MKTIKNSDTIVKIEEIDMSTQINKSEKVRELLENNVITIEDLHIYLNLKNDVQWLIVIPTDKHVRYTFKISKVMINQGTVYFKDDDITEFINNLIGMYEKWKRFILIWMEF